MEQPVRSYDSDVERFDDEIDEYQETRYRFGRSARAEQSLHDPVPLFLSDPEGEPDPHEFANPFEVRRKASISARILVAVLAAAAVAVLFTIFSSDAMRAIIVNAKASIPNNQADQSASAQPEATRLTANDIQLKDPARYSGPGAQTQPAVKTASTVAIAPSRDEITSAYQAALQSRTPAPAPQPVLPPVATAPVTAPSPAAAAAAPIAAPPVAAPPAPSATAARQLDPDELASLMKRARSLIQIGDIAPARLLLERAAEAQEPTAALLLAQTYDPAVLGSQDMRSITPDPEKARRWYEKAVQLGSMDAQQRLAQMQN